MIPTFNCASYLRQTLESVLTQDRGPEQMQIEVVDDCSTKDDPEAVVRRIGQGRVAFFRKPKNEGAIANFNTCIRRSRGRLVHILHGDDWVLPGFYQRVTAVAEQNPDVALIASRSFFVDEENVIRAVTERLRELEHGAKAVGSFFYQTPIQAPGIVVRRSFYEKHGGFLPALIHTADCEMWARAIGLGGGLVMPDVLASYREFAANDSGRLARTGENLKDFERLNCLFAKRYPDFDPRRASDRVCSVAYAQAVRFAGRGESEAAETNLNYWKNNARLPQRLRKATGKVLRSMFA
jgi:glycosyltransferase involved in cell wall biosynthesis